VNIAAGGHKVKVGMSAGLGRLDVGKILGAIHDPKLFVTACEIENLLVLRQDDEGGEADFGVYSHDVLVAVLDNFGLGLDFDGHGISGTRGRLRSRRARSCGCTFNGRTRSGDQATTQQNREKQDSIRRIHERLLATPNWVRPDWADWVRPDWVRISRP